ncbi:hypothetical protein V6N12_044435 [Hibiscus sabdariffa]|uniref:Uncharacterized protein n=1 Tax=Hibiscus sabdariffa TaxID=183260 RepID=A0ABR2BMZ3_9ROSI
MNLVSGGFFLPPRHALDGLVSLLFLPHGKWDYNSDVDVVQATEANIFYGKKPIVSCMKEESLVSRAIGWLPHIGNERSIEDVL